MKRIYLILLVIFITSASSISAANTNSLVWSDNFSEGDLTEWEIVGHNWTGTTYVLWAGNASAANNELWINGSGNQYTVAGYNSSVTHGAWSFDIKAMNSARVAFASDNGVSNYSLSVGGAYVLLLSYTNLELSKRSDGVETDLGSKSIPGLSGNWQHVDITKDSSDRILVKINGTLHFNLTDDTITNSLHFQLVSNQIVVLDNVTVTEGDITTTTTTTTTTATTTTTTTTTTSATPGFDFVTGLILLISGTTLVGLVRHRKKIKD